MDKSQNTKRIAQNTLLLYFRMGITMLVSLYTSRVVLNTLGVEDFGIYNVVGGFVTMFGFLNSAMSSSTQRFLSFEIGKKNPLKLHRTFIMSVNIHFLIALVILVLAETFGLWFINAKLTIPIERMSAALWVYHFSIFSMLLTVISVPYNALIIAHEKMNAFAWISILEVTLKLIVVFLLVSFDFDKLKFYTVLIFIVSIIIRLVYGVYCKSKFEESKFTFIWDKSMYKELISFAGWNLWGGIAYLIRGQGVNILLNMFFGPVVNAARGISFQINNVLNNFVSNLQTAIKPQIIKQYATGNLTNMHYFVFQGSKYSFFLLLCISIPILFETETILRIWLNIVPDYTIIFTRLVIINTLIDSISGTLMTAAQASGKIKLYQSIVGGLLILNLPISYIFLKMGYEPQITLYISIIIYLIALFSRLIILKKLVQLNIKKFINQVVLRCIVVTICSIVLPFVLYHNMYTSFTRFIVITFISIINTLIFIYFIGLDKRDKTKIIQYLSNNIIIKKSKL